MFNPTLSVAGIRQYNYKGSTIKVESMAYRSRELYETIQRMRVDATEVSRLVRKYGFQGDAGVIAGKIGMFRKLQRNSLWKLTVSMQGLTDSVDLNGHSISGIEFISRLRRMRRHQIDRLRSNKIKYHRVKSNTLRAGSMYYRYAGQVDQYFEVIGSMRVGYVHARPNQILETYQARLSRRMFDAVRPMTTERHVGIEIECGVNVTRERLGYLLRPFAGYVMVKGDGSVNVANRQAVELNVCAPISRYKDIVKGVTDVLKSEEVSARVNKSCGLHVHLDVREWRNDFNALSDKYARLISMQGILYSMQPRSRQDNTYCVKSKSRSIVRGASRYQGINAQSIWKYTTIETRLHAGTTDYTKIVNWCDLLIGVMYSTGTVPKRALTRVASIAKYFPIGQSMIQYIIARMNQFANSMTEESESEAA